MVLHQPKLWKFNFYTNQACVVAFFSGIKPLLNVRYCHADSEKLEGRSFSHEATLRDKAKYVEIFPDDKDLD